MIKISAKDIIRDISPNAVEAATPNGKLYIPIERQGGSICPDKSRFVIHEFGEIVSWDEIDWIK